MNVLKLTRIGLLGFACFAAGSTSLFGQDGPPSGHDYAIVLDDVLLRPGVMVDLHLQVFVNDRKPCVGRTILAVPGFAHTAATFGPLAAAMFGGGPAGQAACRVVAVDFPGHGATPAPTGMAFGYLMLPDYVTALLASLERLPSYGVHADFLLAHSQGGLVVQLAQQRLAAAGTSLRAAFNVRDAVLLAPVPPKEVRWEFADSGFAVIVLQSLSAIVMADPVLGPHVALPDAAWTPVFFSNLAGVVAPDAPSAADVVANGYNAPEPLLSALELIGALHLAGFDPTPRPSIQAGIFGAESGTLLQIVTFAEDPIVRSAEGAQTYAHLAGDASGSGLVDVAGTFSMHDLYVSNPAALLDAIAGVIRLR